MLPDTRMYICIKAKTSTDKHVYLIYSVNVKDFSGDSPPIFTKEAVIEGVPSMGCGIFGSKIVLAGGLVQGKDGEDEEKYKGLITFDITSQQASGEHEDVSMMHGAKATPLVFQLNNKLYTLDTIGHLHRRSFEAYYTNQKHWHRLDDPYSSCPNYTLYEASFSEGISRFSWFVVGHCLCISLPGDELTYYHHAKHRLKMFHCWLFEPLPFHGMATTYYHHDFKDVVLISFSKGIVEGRRFLFSSRYLEKPIPIFDTKTYSQQDEDMSGCFVDFGCGNYCLTTFDNVNIYVYMFKISRRKTKKDGTLNLKRWHVKMHKYSYTDLYEADYTGFRFAGCFAQQPRGQTGWSKEIVEADLYNLNSPLDEDEEEEDDVAPYTTCRHDSESEEYGLYDL